MAVLVPTVVNDLGTVTGNIVGGAGCVADGNPATYVQWRAASPAADETSVLYLTGTWSRPAGDTTPAGAITITADVTGADTSVSPGGVFSAGAEYPNTSGTTIPQLTNLALYNWPTSGTAHVIDTFIASPGVALPVISPATAAAIDAAGGVVAIWFNVNGTPTVDLRMYEVTASITWASGGGAGAVTPPLHQRSRVR